jgi:two-component system sensor histidine kinase RpfC
VRDVDSLKDLLQDSRSNDKSKVVLADTTTLGNRIEDFADFSSQCQSLYQASVIIINNAQTLGNEELYSLGYSVIVDYPVSTESLFSALHMQSLQANNSPNFIRSTERRDTSKPNLNILVAEDNKTNQLVIKKILERAGYTPHIVNNGQEALNKIEKNEYDLHIFDMQMPILGGIEAAKIYNYTTEASSRKPVIILTANATTNAIKECESANIDAYLTKPIDINKLLATINRLSKNSPVSDTAPRKTVVNPHSEELIDSSVIESLRSLSDDDSFLATLINGYIDNLDSTLRDMELSISTKDYEKFRELAHGLKGSSGSIGASRLYKLCSIEELIMSNGTEYISRMKEITQTSDETTSELCKYIEHNQSSNNII